MVLFIRTCYLVRCIHSVVNLEIPMVLQIKARGRVLKPKSPNPVVVRELQTLRRIYGTALLRTYLAKLSCRVDVESSHISIVVCRCRTSPSAFAAFFVAMRCRSPAQSSITAIDMFGFLSRSYCSSLAFIGNCTIASYHLISSCPSRALLSFTSTQYSPLSPPNTPAPAPSSIPSQQHKSPH